jgi:tetratricopeptide (TPR) repeat protein
MRNRPTNPRAAQRALLPALALTLATLTLLAAPPAPAHASGESGGSEIDKQREPGESPDDAAARMRKSAMEHYAKGYEETEEAAEELLQAQELLKNAGATDASTKAARLRSGAKKRYEKAVDHFQKAVKLDPGYHEAWNMLGYSFRRLGRLGEAFQAYDTCLKLMPEYEPAREYLGEAWLQAGNLEKAKAELAWLTEKKSTEGEKLAAAIARYEAGDSTSFGAGW